MKISLHIDTKSLYLNIRNDNKKGHTATVATPIKQYNSINKSVKQIFTIPKQKIDFQNDLNLITKLLEKSKSLNRITNVFVFDKISVNGITIETDANYCMFVKEEIDETKVHFGRTKLHYPRTLKFIDDETVIDNQVVLNVVSKQLNDYAFIVRSFDFDFNSEVLNFDCEIVGENGVLYSKVFLNSKGKGTKFNDHFYEKFDNYDIEKPIIEQSLDFDVNPENYLSIIENKKRDVILKIQTQLKKMGHTRIKNISENYPYALYDIESYYLDKKHYFIVTITASKVEYFDLSIAKFNFITNFPDYAQLICVSQAFDKPVINYYSYQDIKEFTRNINSMRFTNGR